MLAVGKQRRAMKKLNGIEKFNHKIAGLVIVEARRRKKNVFSMLADLSFDVFSIIFDIRSKTKGE